MKKFLSLVLALVMTMSLVTISAGAKDFADDSDIDYKEAVDVISALGIVDGYSDSSFRPDGSLTRGAAAKIICNLILGPTTASALSATTAPFKDVPTTNVFAGYITYCAQQGIIGGYGDGTFRPSGTLTGNAFMKMLLGALGYDSSIEGYTGSNWQVNVTKQAIGIGLDDGNDEFAGSKAVTRQEAALYACNMLQATMVEYENKSTIVVGGVEINTTSTRKDVTNTASRTDGNIGDADGLMQFAERYFTNLKLETSSDDFGRPANVWTYKSDEIGTYAKNSDLVATFTARVNADDIYDAVGRNVYDSLSDGKSVLYNYVDGDGGRVARTDIDSYVERNNTTKVNSSDNGMLTEVYVDDDNNVSIVSVNTYVFQAVSDYSASRDSVSLTKAGDTAITLTSSTLDGEDFDIKNIKADDYILVTAVKDGSRYEVKSVAVAEKTTGMVNGYKLDSNVTIGDTEYKYSATALDKNDDSGVRNTMYTVGQDAAVVLDQYGYIIAVDAAVVSNNYVYISEFAQPSGLSNGKIVASAFFTDGTTADITVRELLGSSSKNSIMPSGNHYTNAGWYTYSVNSSNEYSLYAVESKYGHGSKGADWGKEGTYDDADGQIMFNGSVNFLKVSGNSGDDLETSAPKANDKTIVVVNDKQRGDVMVYTGVRNIPDITLKAADPSGINAKGEATVSLLANNNYAYYVYIETKGNTSIAGSENTNLVYYVTFGGQHRGNDNDNYYTYTVLNGLDEASVVADTTVRGTSDIYNAYYKTRVNSDEQVTSVQSVPNYNSTTERFFGTYSAVTNAITYKDGALSIGGKDYTLADNYTITLVTVGEDLDNDKVTAAGLNVDKNANYEADSVTARELADRVNGWNIEYTFQGKTTENGGSVIEELYVTVTEAVNTNVVNAAKPTTPAVTGKTSYTVGEQVEALTATSTVTDGGTITYTWYKDSVADANKVGTGATFTPAISTASAATYTFKVVATNTNNDVDGSKTTNSDVQTVTITVGKAVQNQVYQVLFLTDVDDDDTLVDGVQLTDACEDGMYALTQADVEKAMVGRTRLANYKISSYSEPIGFYSETPKEIRVKVEEKTADVDVTVSVNGFTASGNTTSSAKVGTTFDITLTQQTAGAFDAEALAALNLALNDKANGDLSMTATLDTPGVGDPTNTQAVIKVKVTVTAITDGTKITATLASQA